MHSKPFQVLGKYKPEVWNPKKVGLDLCAFTKSMSLIPLKDPVHGPQTWVPWFSEKLHAEVKRRTPKNPKGEEWHQDGDLDPGSNMDHALVLWSSNTSTEFLYNGVVYRPKRLEVVIARNLGCVHRRPPGAPRIRWLFRQRVEVPEWLT